MSGLMDSWMWGDWFREATGMQTEAAEPEFPREEQDDRITPAG
jgi:hypothetical protein